MSETQDDRTRDLGGTLAGDPTPPLEIGTLLRGTYRVLGVLGSGGMGTVLHALDEPLDREVAIKLLHREVAASTISLELFRAEARAMARVRHPNVVEIHTFGEHDGRPYFVMQYVPGTNLSRWLHTQGVPSIGQAIEILDQICHGVTAIHDARAVHHDLKPSNVLLGPAQRAFVADLGLAGHIDAPSRFATGELAGTPAYMAPELARGEPVDPAMRTRLDVYALGVVAFELLTGDLPFRAKAVAGMLSQHAYHLPPAPSTIRPELTEAFDAVLRRALAKRPEERTPSAEALRRELNDAWRKSATPASHLYILVADDDLVNLRVTVDVLAEEFPGARIDSCSDADAAVAATKRARPDIVITDLHMPGGGGRDLTARLRADPATRDVPIVVVTGYGGATDWQWLKRMGADRFLVKPVDTDSLVGAIRSLVEAR